MREHFGVNVDRHDVTGELRHLQGEPSVAAAQVDNVHAGHKADLGQYACGVRPERLPPGSVRHLCALKKSRQVAAHYPSRATAARLTLSQSVHCFTASSGMFFTPNV